MLPPLVRRCPRCGYLGWTHRFDRVDEVETDEDERLVECPRCGHDFGPRENPWLAALRLRS